MYGFKSVCTILASRTAIIYDQEIAKPRLLKLDDDKSERGTGQSGWVSFPRIRNITRGNDEQG